ncbi:CpsD/CapB family tyrosine-protein kinase [Salipiger pallidus]|nr:CpsD/CapB family tyrosine-protein kinase [Salipiger pallidus]
MIERRKFRRRNRPLDEDTHDPQNDAPIPPLETREERLARRNAEADAEASLPAQHDEITAETEPTAAAQAAETDASPKADTETESDPAAEPQTAERDAQYAAIREAEKARRTDQARKALETRRATAARAALEARRAQEALQAKRDRLAGEDHAAKEQLLTQEAQAAEEHRLAQEAQAAEEQRLAQEAQAAEEQRLAQEAQAAEEQRLAQEAQAAEEQRLAQEAQAAEEQRLAQEAQAAEEQRLAQEAQAAEEQRLARRLRETDESRRDEMPSVRTARSTEAKLRKILTTEPRNEQPASQAADDQDEQQPGAKPSAFPLVSVEDEIRRNWDCLGRFSVDAGHLERNRIVTAGRDDPAHAAFDVLRTRLLQALSERGWKRVAVTSPSQGCGKTFTAANLAISLSRQQNCRTLLLDCDLRRPTLHKVIGVDAPGSMGDVLRGRTFPEQHLLRMGENSIHAGDSIAFGFNGVAEPYASELLQSPEAAAALDRMEDMFKPDVVLFDLPPALYYDDVIAFKARFDGVLLVLGGGLSTPKEVREVERRMGEDTPLLGTVLNKAEGTTLSKYTY